MKTKFDLIGVLSAIFVVTITVIIGAVTQALTKVPMGLICNACMVFFFLNWLWDTVAVTFLRAVEAEANAAASEKPKITDEQIDSAINGAWQKFNERQK